MSVEVASGSARSRAQGLYRIIWRWHFYAGLFCIPFLLCLAISGAIYLFKPQIDAWTERPYQHLVTSGERSSANAQISAALRAVPQARFLSYRLPRTQSEAVAVSLMRNGERVLVYVDPYGPRVLRRTAYDDQFTRRVRAFHGELWAGDAGSVLVELAGSWAIVLIVTGLYLWWPRSASGLAGVLYPRLGRGGKTFWRDLHAVTGVWISMLVLFLLISGLPWALVWGNALKLVRSLANPSVQQDWSTSHAAENHLWRSAAAHGADLRPQLLANAMALNFAPPAELTLIDASSQRWRLSSESQNRTLRADATFDGNTGAVIGIARFADRPGIDRIVGIGVAAHEGQLFGWLNQLLGLIAASGVVVLTVTGFVLWRRRKPASRLGAPPALPSAVVGRTVAGIVIVLAAMLPVLALSLLTLLLIEWALLRRLRALRHWLGLTAVA